MKKVLLTYDGNHFSESLMAFTRQMDAKQPVLATAVFLPEVDFVEMLYSYGGGVAGPMYVNEVVPVSPAVLQQNAARFTELCRQAAIPCRVHTEPLKNVVTQLAHESTYADLLVISGNSFYSNLGEDTQHDYLENSLHKANCPVLLLPENYEAPQSIILAYDGSERSVYAIKQFAYLFPWMADVPAVLVHFGTEEEIPARQLIEELVSCYFTNLTVLQTNVAGREAIAEWLAQQQLPMLVTGAYGRSAFSEALKRSFLSELLNDIKFPVFVAHK